MKTVEHTVDNLQNVVNGLCDEWAADDTFIERMCEVNGVPDHDIYGDSYSVPGIQEKVTSLVKVLGGKLPSAENNS